MEYSFVCKECRHPMAIDEERCTKCGWKNTNAEPDVPHAPPEGLPPQPPDLSYVINEG